MIFKLPKSHSCSVHPGQVVTYVFDFLVVKVGLSDLLLFLKPVDDFSSFFSVVAFIQIIIYLVLIALTQSMDSKWCLVH